MTVKGVFAPVYPMLNQAYLVIPNAVRDRLDGSLCTALDNHQRLPIIETPSDRRTADFSLWSK